MLVVAMAAAQMEVPVFVNKNMAKEELATVSTMCDYLGKAAKLTLRVDSTGKFAGTGIYVTTASADAYRQFPAAMTSMGTEAVYLKCTRNSTYIVANSTAGIRHGIFLYLDKLGFRFYFPDPLWHIIPARESIFVDYEGIAKPDFRYRSLTMGWGFGTDKLKEQFQFWEKANLMGGDLPMNINHAYDILILENRKAFEDHPEFLSKPLLNGKRQQGAVFNYGSPALADLAYASLVRRFESAKQKNTPLIMQSMEPFDGPTFCDLPSCLKAGKTASDQVFYFTNEVARKLKRTHPDKLIGVLAYYDHIDIPKFKVEDNIFVALTNGYNTSFYTIDQLIERWKTKAKAKWLAIYDYISIYAGSSADLPVKSPGSNYRNVAGRIKRFKRAGIVSYQAETAYGWIGKGLGHYMAAKMTWDSALNPEMIADEFFKLSFPQTVAIIKPLYESWDSTVIVTEDNLHQWFSSIRKAFAVCNNNAELARLQQVALYLFYTKMYRDYIEATGEVKKQKGIELCAFLWETMPQGIVSSYAALYVIPPTLGNEYLITNKDAVWKTQKIAYPGSKSEWISFIDAYLPQLRKIDNNVKFGHSSTFKMTTPNEVSRRFSWVNPKRTFTFSGSISAVIDTKGMAKDSLFIRMRGGTYKKAGRIGIKVYAWNENLTPAGPILKEVYFPADGKQYIISLKSLKPDRYILSFSDDGTLGEVYFPENSKFSINVSEQDPLLGGSSNNLYFYVPAGTKKFYIKKTFLLLVYDAKNQLKKYPELDKLLEVDVKEGEAGWWHVQIQRGPLILIGIPPLVSRDPQSFLFP